MNAMSPGVRKATRRKAKLRLGIAATAGAGKTMGALLLAYGLVSDWNKIGIVDTEHGSGELYVNHKVPGTNFIIGEYLYYGIEPPFTVAKYIEGQRALEDAGCEVIIHDSTTHAWAGAGGLLDKQGKIAAKTGNSYTAWRDVTPDHNLFVDTMLGSPAHIIATMRSKTEYVLETNDKGKQAPRKIGMAPVQREGMDFEFTVMLDIDQSHQATATKDRTSVLDGEFFKLSPEIGKRLRAWLETGADAPVAPPRREEPAMSTEGPRPARPTLRGMIRDLCATVENEDQLRSIEERPDYRNACLKAAPEIKAELEGIVTAARERLNGQMSDAA